MKKRKEEYYLVHWWDAQAEHSVYLSEALKKNTNLAVQKTVGRFVKINKKECTMITTRCGDEADIITIPRSQIIRIFPMIVQSKKIGLQQVRVIE